MSGARVALVGKDGVVRPARGKTSPRGVKELVHSTRLKDLSNAVWKETFWALNWCATQYVWGEFCDPNNLGFNCSGLPHWNFFNRLAVVYVDKSRHFDFYIGSYKPEIIGMRKVNNIAPFKVYYNDPGASLELLT